MKSSSHYERSSGSYKYMMRGSTSFSNLFMAGDWIINRYDHAYRKNLVSGLEAANTVIDYLELGSFAKITPVEEDHLDILAFRNLNRNLHDIKRPASMVKLYLPMMLYPVLLLPENMENINTCRSMIPEIKILGYK